MIRLLIPLLFLITLSCNNSKDIESENLESRLNVFPTSLSFNHEGGIQRVEIEADMPWYISSTLPEWIVIKEQHISYLDISVLPNVSEKNRSHIITFQIDNKTTTLEIHQRTQEKLYFESKERLYIHATRNRYNLSVISNIDFETSILDNGKEWITLINTIDEFPSTILFDGRVKSRNISFEVSDNTTQSNRSTGLVIRNNSYNITDTLEIIQEGIKDVTDGEKYTDGMYICLQKANKGFADLVIMGEAYTSEDLYKNGKYEQSIKLAADYFFSLEPLKSFRSYFNVYMVVAESPTNKIGQNEIIGFPKASNKFGTAYGSGTEIVCDTELVLEYAQKVKTLDEKKPTTVIVVLNDSKYAGTTYLYSNGNSIALCPMSQEPSPNDFEGVIHHEAGGHGFGFLCDEYVYHQEEIPEDSKKNIQEWQKLGFQMNVDFTNDSKAVHWKDLIGLPQYSQVGLYEGGYMYQYGIWRSESNSCMNNNIPYFNAQSRWCITKRIMDISGVDFTIEDFIRIDKVDTPSTRAMNQTYSPPLGAPKWILK